MSTPSVLVALRVPRLLHTQLEECFSRRIAAQSSKPHTWTSFIIRAIERQLDEDQRQEDYRNRKRRERRLCQEMLPDPVPDIIVEGNP